MCQFLSHSQEFMYSPLSYLSLFFVYMLTLGQWLHALFLVRNPVPFPVNLWAFVILPCLSWFSHSNEEIPWFFVPLMYLTPILHFICLFAQVICANCVVFFAFSNNILIHWFVMYTLCLFVLSLQYICCQAILPSYFCFALIWLDMLQHQNLDQLLVCQGNSLVITYPYSLQVHVLGYFLIPTVHHSFYT